jgi:hypothetical protein
MSVVAELVKKIAAFMETEGSLPPRQVSAGELSESH